MLRKIEKQDRNRKTKLGDHLETELDALFRLPLAEFTSARNALAAQLKKSGRGNDASYVKSLGKPPVSAWTVNQLYWDHREAFNELLSSGERFHKAQSSRSAGKVADMREALDARRKALAHLSDLATSLLQSAGNNPTLDTIRRITTTLEALSADTLQTEAQRLGRLTKDVDPPGFETLASFVPGSGSLKSTAKLAPVSKSRSVSAFTRPRDDARQAEDARKDKIAEARASLQEAKRSLTEARNKAKSLEIAQKKVDAEVREAQERLKKARVAAEEAAKLSKDAERTVEKAARELEKLFRQS
jgi:hypothetical protein